MNRRAGWSVWLLAVIGLAACASALGETPPTIAPLTSAPPVTVPTEEPVVHHDEPPAVASSPSSQAPTATTPPPVTPEQTKAEQKDGTTLYRWAWAEVPKLAPEPSMPGWGEASASLHVSTYKDWASVGRFYWGLVRDQLTATDELKRTAQALVQGIPADDDAAKVRAIYDFVVSKTRYVGLEFGARAGVHTPVSACATGSEAIGYALNMIRTGRADIVVCCPRNSSVPRCSRSSRATSSWRGTPRARCSSVVMAPPSPYARRIVNTGKAAGK